MTIILNGTTGITSTGITETSDGNVGIGTISPDGKMDIESSVSDHLTLTRTGVGNYSFGVGGSNALQISNSGTERVRIDSSGNLYFGTAGANVPSSTRPGTAWGFGGGSNNYWINAVNSTGAASHWSFVNGNGAVGGITTNGSATAYNTSSDYRLKKDWVAVADASTRVNALKPVNFAWVSSGKRVDGFLAHELAEVVPEAVTGFKDAVDDEENPVYQGIDQSKLVPLLTAALQEALAKIDELTARVSALEAK